MQKEKLWTKDFVLIILINFLVFMNHIMIVSTFPMYLEQVLDLNEAIAGMAALGFSLVAVVLRPFIGWALDQGHRKGILIIGLAGMLLMPLGYLFSDVITQAVGFAAAGAIALAIICRMLHGASLALCNTSNATIASDALPQSRFAEGMGYFGMATALATSLAPALSLALMNISFNLLFAVTAAFMAISLILFLLMRTHEVPVREKKPLSLKGLIDPDAVPASLICLIFLFSWGALENFLADYAIKYDLPSGGIFFAITAVMLLLTRFTVGKVADRKGEGIFVYTCSACMFAALLLLGLVPNTATFLLAAVLAGYAFGGLEPALQSMAVHIAPPERRGSANSTFLCAYDIGMGGGGAVAGWLIAGLGYQHMFLVMTLAAVLSVVLYLFWGRNHPSSLRFAHK